MCVKCVCTFVSLWALIIFCSISCVLSFFGYWILLICYFSWSSHCGSDPDFGELKVVVALHVVENILMFSPMGWQIASNSCQSTEDSPSCLTGSSLGLKLPLVGEAVSKLNFPLNQKFPLNERGYEGIQIPTVSRC